MMLLMKLHRKNGIASCDVNVVDIVTRTRGNIEQEATHAIIMLFDAETSCAKVYPT